MAEQTDGRYRGTVALSTAVPDRQGELVLAAVDIWDHVTVLRGTASVVHSTPFWFPHIWGLTTDDGTAYACTASGATSMHWTVSFEPGIPDSARQLGIHIGPDTSRPPAPDGPPADPTLVVPLTGWPKSPQDAPARLDPSLDLGPPVGPRPTLEGVPVRPVAVLPVSAHLDDAIGLDLNVLSIETYPTWFFLHLGGSGSLYIGDESGSVTPEMTMQHHRRRWTAEDDQGHLYNGTVKSTHSGFPWIIDAPFTPALTPTATTLTLSLPNPFTPGTIHTTVPLPRMR